MDILHVSVLLLVLITPSFGKADPPLEVIFEDNSTKVDTSVGAENIKFRCIINQGPMYVLQNKAEFIHVNPVSSKETLISSGGALKEGKPEFYDVKINFVSDEKKEMFMELTILQVRFQDDGKFICRVTSEEESAMAEREVVVHRPMTALKLKFGDYEPILETPEDAIPIDHGKYKVSCIAEGSNPATEDVHLFLHGEMVPHDKPVVKGMDDPERKFSTTVSGKVNIVVSNSGQELECQAKDSTGVSMSTKFEIHVNFYDPEVHCNDSEAYHGMDNPILMCTVNYTDLEVKGYAFQIGDTGEIIEPGQTHSKNIIVQVTDVAPGISIVSLDLHKAEHEYLDKHYYLLTYLEGGHTSKANVQLIEVENPDGPDDSDGEGPSDSGGRISFTAFLYVMICAALFYL